MVPSVLPWLVGFQEAVAQVHAHADNDAHWVFTGLGGIPWFGWIAIVAIVSGCISGSLNQWHKHRERMEMIRHGMHPDQPPTGDEMASYKASHPEL